MSDSNPRDGDPAGPLVAERRAKLERLRQLGPAYPNDFIRTDTAADLQSRYAQTTGDDLNATPIAVAVAGRLMLKRLQGKVSFATVQDGSGRIQLFVTDDDTGAQVHEEFRHWDIGDIVGARGVLFRTKRGELTVRCKEVRLLAKALRPLPDKFHGLADHEMRYRRRYVDLIVNESTRRVFQMRSRAVAELRRLMIEQGFLEVETPMLQLIPGGAAARPFVTHHHTLDIDMYLRVAPELYLKRLVVGGFERVFEINRNFRNEGISPRHNPEFTMLEFYAAYQDVRWMMDFIEQLLRQTALATTGSATLAYQGQTIDLAPCFERLTIVEAICRHRPDTSSADLSDPQWLRSELRRLGAEAPQAAGVGSLQLTLFEHTAEARLIQPTFIVDYPVEVSPLARASDKQPDVAERFELFIAGRETANGFSELNDPDDQAERFRRQAEAKQAGDEEAMYYDADYIRALEYGMPPAAGCGIGVDRFVMLLADVPSIRDVILFPHLRPGED
jgi:lysyl-tRNA synthetase, class II